jgi:putative transposase
LFLLFSLETTPMTRKLYPSDLTDEQWAILAPMIPPPRKNVRPRQADMREVLNAILYLLRTGCPWRHMPHDLPPYRTVYYYFAKWRKCGVWKKIHDKLHERLRELKGRQATPSAAILDSQSVKTTEKGGLRAVTTLARRLKDASAILSSIPWD